METDEISLVKKLVVLWRGRKLIMLFAFFSVILSTVYAFYLPPIYKAECYFLPPNQDTNRISSLTGSMMSNTTANMTERIGGVADLAGLPQTVTSGQMIIGIMKRNVVIDPIIERFALMEVYKQEYKSKMREKFLRDIVEATEDTKSGLITVSVVDEDPQRAAEMANALVETLQAKMLDLSLNEAVQRRVFFEDQTEKSRVILNQAEADMLAYQQESGYGTPESQLQARLGSITELQQQIVAKNAEISALLTYARQDNPRVKAARSQLATLTQELERLQAEQKTSVPQLNTEYQKYATALHLATTAYEVVLKQYENAKIDEAQGFFPLQIVDYATPPDFKFKPSRARIIIVGTFLGTILGCVVVVSKSFIRAIKKAVDKYSQDMAEDDEDEVDSVPVKMNQLPAAEHKRPIIVFGFVIFVVAAIFFLTFQSQPDTLEISRKFQHILMNFFDDDNMPLWVSNMNVTRTFAHVPLYFVLAVTAFVSLSLYGVTFRHSLAIALLLSVCVGLADEIVKIYIPGREFDLVDWVLDIIGSVAGLLTVVIISLLFRRRNADEEDS